ncbi:MAG TPA: DUF6580 family putative transport protein [Kofleriaceae bacterium]
MLAVLLVLVCAFCRVIPHPPNFAPVGATAVLAGRTLRPLPAIALTLAAMALADIALAALHGWQPFGIGTLFIYGGFAAQVLIARALRQRRGGALAAAVLGATVFFALSNFGVWVLGGLYPRTFDGLVTCYVAALPFYGSTLIGDVVWTIALVLAWRSLAKPLARSTAWVPADSLEARPL